MIALAGLRSRRRSSGSALVEIVAVAGEQPDAFGVTPGNDAEAVVARRAPCIAPQTAPAEPLGLRGQAAEAVLHGRNWT